MLSKQQIAQALRITREEFRTVFEVSQRLAGFEGSRIKDFHVLTADEPVNTLAFEKALDYAEREEFFEKVLYQIINRSLETGQIANAFIAAAPMQAITDAAVGFTNPELFGKKIVRYTKMIGKVLVRGHAAGSGILISHNLFLTAWHVVQSYFTAKPGNPKEYDHSFPGPELQVEFNNITDWSPAGLTALNPIRVGIHKDWLVKYSPCHPDEILKKIPQRIEDLIGYEDYAIIRLVRTVGMERGILELDSRCKLPTLNSNITILQHPQGVPLQMDTSPMVDVLPSGPDPVKARFIHQANTAQGSSGGFCFDNELRPVGVHQGEWPMPYGGKPSNRGVPISNIISHYQFLPLPSPEDCPIWSVTPQILPFVGYEELQKNFWSQLLPGGRRILSIIGMQKAGKSFLCDLILELLEDASHLKIVVPVQTIVAATALDVFKLIAERAGITQLPVIRTVEEYGSTLSVWLKDELLATLIRLLGEQRSERKVWVFFRDFNGANFTSREVSELLFMLYEKVGTIDWLRIVLDDVQTALPNLVSQYILLQRCRDLTEDEIITCMQRACNHMKADPQVGGLLASICYDEYVDLLATNPVAALETLNKSLVRSIRRITPR